MVGIILWAAVFCLCAIRASDAKLEITPYNNGTITTFQSEVKLQGIAFTKRSINLTASTSIAFKVNGTRDTKAYKLTWFVNGIDISGHVKRYEKIPAAPTEHAYSTEVIGAEDFSIVTLYLLNRRLVPGVYSLSVTPSGSSVPTGFGESFILASPMLPLFSKVRKVLDGDPMTLFCEVTGYPLPSEVTWKFAHIKSELMEDSASLTEAADNLNTLPTSSNAYNFSTIAVTNDQLVFEKLPREFSGLYGCYVTGANGDNDSTLILVNIKDRWAALWPFIGIVIEVTLLVSGILLYERHQMRSRAVKNEPLATADPMSPSTVPQATNATQQNSVPAASEQHGRDKPGTEDASEEKPDIRQRGAPQC